MNYNSYQCMIEGIEIYSVDMYGKKLIGHTLEFADKNRAVIEGLTSENEKYKNMLIENGLLEPELTLDDLRAENKELRNKVDSLIDTVNKLLKKSNKDNKKNQNNEVNDNVNY